MNGPRRGGYAAALGTLLVAGAVVCGGVALADDDGGSHNGADGRNGTATTHCKQKFSTDVYAPMQCYPDSGNARGTDGGNGTNGSDSVDGHGRDGANGTAVNNGASTGPHGAITGNGTSSGNGASSDYKNPVTQERHFIPLPNIG